MMKPIVESGMPFGPYDESECFYVEKSDIYQRVREGVSMVEFCLLRKQTGKPVVWFVEAKSSAPNPNGTKFDDYTNQIKDKFVNALALVMSMILKRHSVHGNEFPDTFKSLSLSELEVRFVLVVREHPESWLPPLADALKRRLNATLKVWAFSPNSVVVLNDKMALKYGLIRTFVPDAV